MNRRPRQGLLRRYLRFAAERFPPQTHLVYAAALSCASLSAQVEGGLSEVGIGTIILGWLATAALLLVLRILDDVKDSEDDRTLHPDRPIPSGLVSAGELMGLGAALFAASVLTLSIITPRSLVPLLVYGGWAALMYRGFFAKVWLERRVALFVFSHTVIALPLVISIGLVGTTTGAPVAGSGAPALSLWAFAGVAWFASAGYDFARKLLLESEPGFEHSYVAEIGLGSTLALGAIAVALTAAASILVGSIRSFPFWFHLGIGVLAAATLVSGLATLGTRRWAPVFRGLATAGNLIPFVLVSLGALG